MNKIGRIERIRQFGNDIYADVRMEDGDVGKNFAFIKPLSGFICSPQEGDWVSYFKSHDDEYYINGIVNHHDEEIPDLSSSNEDELVLNFGENKEIKITEKDGVHHLDINFDGEVTINAEKGIFVGENGTKVAKQDHTHPISWTDSAGSGNSDTPNEEGTETMIK